MPLGSLFLSLGRPFPQIFAGLLPSQSLLISVSLIREAFSHHPGYLILLPNIALPHQSSQPWMYFMYYSFTIYSLFCPRRHQAHVSRDPNEVIALSQDLDQKSQLLEVPIKIKAQW